MDREQIQLLQLAAQETDPIKLMALIEEVLASFEAQDNLRELREVLSYRRDRQSPAQAVELPTL